LNSTSLRIWSRTSIHYTLCNLGKDLVRAFQATLWISCNCKHSKLRFCVQNMSIVMKSCLVFNLIWERLMAELVFEIRRRLLRLEGGSIFSCSGFFPNCKDHYQIISFSVVSATPYTKHVSKLWETRIIWLMNYHHF
jgi:hypothetical protein